MGTGNKNGKQRTKNIHSFRFTCLLLLIFVLSGFQYFPSAEKTWVIVIDPGHGGRDPGALGSRTRESNLALAIALKTGDYMEKNLKNVKVLYTRKSDVAVELRDRAEFANRNKADLFISVHVNWAGAKNIRGTETYIMGLAKDEANLEVAMKENEVILLEENFSTKYEGFDPKSTESYIMFTSMQNIFQEQSTALASGIQNQFRNRAGRVDRGVKQAGFWVLFMTTMPSVLVETGFITNLEEEKYLNTNEGQEFIASGIYRAARDYINDVGKRSNISTITDSAPLINADSAIFQAIPDTDKISFMVQITSSAIHVDIKPENFRGIADVTELSSQGRFRYASGSFPSYPDAIEYRKKIETLYPDAFVIAVRNNKIVPLLEALDSKLNQTNQNSK